MGLEVGAVASTLPPRRLPASDTRRRHGLGQGLARCIAGGVDLAIRELAAERSATEHRQITAFFVLERDDIDRGAASPFGRGARDLDAVDNTHRAVEPTAVGNRIAV